MPTKLMAVIRISDPDDPRLAAYRGVSDPDLLRAGGLFIAEGRLVVRRLLTASRFRARSVLITEPALVTIADVLPGHESLPVFVVPQDALNELAGFNIHRGCLALGERPEAVPLGDIVGPRSARTRLIVLEGVSNADNIGGIFRCAAAFGASGVVLGPGCCDPLYRKAIRTSIGATLHVPFVSPESWLDALGTLRAHGWRLVALTPSSRARELRDIAADLQTEPRLALLLGSEYAGLSPETLSQSDYQVRIGIDPAVDSLNVAVAAGIALHAVSSCQRG